MKRKLLIALAAVVGLLAAVAILIVILVNPETIKEEALSRIRQATDYTVEAGDASLALGWKGAGLRVQSVSAIAPDSSQSLAVEEIDLFLKLFPLLTRRVELAEVVLHRPRYAVRSGASSEPRSGSGGSPAVAVFAIESWTIEDGAYHQEGPWGSLDLEGLRLRGTFRWKGTEGGAGEVSGRSSGGRFRAAAERPLPGFETSLQFRIAGDLETITVEPIRLEAGALKVDARAAYRKAGSGWAGTLSATSEAITWSGLEPLLPPDLRESLAAVELGGTVTLSELEVVTTAEGSHTAGAVRFEGVSARAAEAPMGLSGTRGVIRFDPDRVVLEEAAGTLGEDPVRFSGDATLAEPRQGRLSVATRIPGATLGRLLPAQAGLVLTGGTLDLDLTATTALPPEGIPPLNGRILLEGFRGTYRKLPLTRADAQIELNGRQARIASFQAALGRSDFALSGTVPEIANPRLQFQLRSSVLDLNELFPEEKDGATEAGGGAVGLPGEGTVEVGTVHFKKLTLESLTTRARLDLDGVELTKLDAAAYGGRVTGDLAFRPVGGGATWRYEGKLHLDGLRPAQALLAWTGIADRLEGRIGGDLVLDGLSGPDIDPMRAFNMNGSLAMVEGAVLNVPNLHSLGEVFGIRAIRPDRWPFQGLDLAFAVKEGRVIVEGLDFAQPGLAWNLVGGIGLDGALDLSGTLRADPARVTLPKELEVLRPYLVEPDGRIPLDFTLTGPFTSPVPALDWDGLTERAAKKAKAGEAEKLKQELEKRIDNPETLKKLKNLIGGKP